MNQKRAFELMIMRFIDAYVDLHGEINTTTIINQFPIHRTKASRIVQLYLKPKPSNLRYVPSKSCHLKGFSFEVRPGQKVACVGRAGCGELAPAGDSHATGSALIVSAAIVQFPVAAAHRKQSNANHL